MRGCGLAEGEEAANRHHRLPDWRRGGEGGSFFMWHSIWTTRLREGGGGAGPRSTNDRRSAISTCRVNSQSVAACRDKFCSSSSEEIDSAMTRPDEPWTTTAPETVGSYAELDP